ncbi:MAG: class I SAM-dependent methyltransferase [Leadbetterella sp.]|nr:class I SAM-dependent methyltransferase [Leadbetterella sp.]
MNLKYLLFLTLVIINLSCFNKQYDLNRKLSIEKEIDSYQLTSTDTLVDIGSGIGLFDIEIAHYSPNLFLILEDLDIKENYSRGRPQVYGVLTNNRYTPNIEGRFKFLVGKKDSIPLESNKFEKILCRNTFHEFDDRSKMIEELFRILKPGGELIISERKPKYNGEKDKSCKMKYVSEYEILESFKLHEFKRKNLVDYPKGTMNIIVFTK